MFEYNFSSDTIDLIIVGNGFDLANNFKTSYKDFVQSKHFIEIVPNNDLAKRIHYKIEIQNWVDVEMEIAEHSNYLFEKYKGDIPNDINEKFEKEFNELSDALNNFINDISNFITNPFMVSKVKSWLERTFIEHKKIFIMTFNYINYDFVAFTEKTPRVLLINETPAYIHGNAIHSENKIVLGVDERNIKCKQHLFLLKSLNKNTDTKGYFSYIGKADRIVLFGCSLGETDYRYYEPIFRNTKNKKYEIYCYGYKEYLKIRNQINEYADSRKDLFYEENEVIFYDSSDNNFPTICTNKK